MGEVEQIAKEKTGPNTELIVERYVSNGRGGRGNMSERHASSQRLKTHMGRKAIRDKTYREQRRRGRQHT